MLTKDNVIKTLSDFPDIFSLDEFVDKLIFMEKLERGLDQSVNNQVVTQEEAGKRLEKWLK
jgi:hypothetical protein